MISPLRKTVLGIYLLSVVAQAQNATYGAEFTFTSFDLAFAKSAEHGRAHTVSTSENDRALEEMRKTVASLCAHRSGAEKCRIEFIKDPRGLPSYRVIYPDGWWWQMALDPGVIEVQTKPSTANELRSLKERMRQDIFATAAKTQLLKSKADPRPGLIPIPQIGGGHIHIGNDSAFGNDAKLFRNFLVDYANHAGLAMGALGNDDINAKAFAHLKPEQRAGFEQAIREFDEGKIKTIKQLASAIETYSYSLGCDLEKNPNKYHAACVQRATNSKMKPHEKTTEIRALRAQRNVDEFLREVELFDARIQMLKNVEEPIPLVNQAAADMDPSKIVSHFYSYITGAGLDPDKYASLLPKDLKHIYEGGEFSPQLLVKNQVRGAPNACQIAIDNMIH